MTMMSSACTGARDASWTSTSPDSQYFPAMVTVSVGCVVGAVGDGGDVARAVERGADVVAHAAVDGDVGADAGHILDGADGVDRDTGWAGERAPGFDGQLGLGEAVGRAAVREGADDGVGVVVYRGWLVVLGIGDGEAAAGAEAAQVHAVLAHARREPQHALDRLGVRLQFEDGGAKVEVDALHVQVRRGHHLPHRLFGVAGLDREAELAVQHARGGEAVGVRVYGGRNPDEDRLLASGCHRRFVQQAQLVEAVDHEPPDAPRDALRDLRRRLVVAVEIGGGEVDPGGAQHGHFAARHHVETEAEARDVARERDVDERLAGVDDAGVGVAGAEGVQEALRLVPQRGFVEHVEGRAELAGEGGDVAAAYLQVAVVVDGGGDGEHFRSKGDGHGVLLSVIRAPRRTGRRGAG